MSTKSNNYKAIRSGKLSLLYGKTNKVNTQGIQVVTQNYYSTPVGYIESINGNFRPCIRPDVYVPMRKQGIITTNQVLSFH